MISQLNNNTSQARSINSDRDINIVRCSLRGSFLYAALCIIIKAHTVWFVALRPSGMIAVDVNDILINFGYVSSVHGKFHLSGRGGHGGSLFGIRDCVIHLWGVGRV